MTSIFSLKTDVKQLAGASVGITSMNYEKVAPSRDVTLANFPNGTIRFNVQCSGTKWWFPSRSYLRTRFNLKKTVIVGGNPVDVPLTVADGIAPNMGLCSNLIQSCEYQIGGKTVSRVSDYIAQIDALETRLSKSKGWLDSSGSTTNFWQSNQAERVQQVSSNGAIGVPVGLPGPEYEIKTQDLLPIPAPATTTIAYNKDTGVVTFAGANAVNTAANFVVGDYLVITSGILALNVLLEIIAVPAGVLTMTVRADYAVDIPAAVRTFSRYRPLPLANLDASRAGRFELIWQPPLSIFKLNHALPVGGELHLNPQTSSEFQRRGIESALGLASKVPGTDYKLEIEDMYLYVNTLEGDRFDDGEFLLDLEQTRCQADKIQSANFSSRQFDVSPATYALTVAYQDARTGTNTSLSPSKFKVYDDATASVELERQLSRFFINYAGRNIPSPDADPVFSANVNQIVEMYTNTILNSGSYFSEGGSESLREFGERGAYYYYPWPRDGTDRSTRVQINNQFSGAVGSNMRVLLFDHSRQVARVRVSQGRVIDCVLEEQ